MIDVSWHLPTISQTAVRTASHLSTIPTKFIPKGGPHGSSIPQHGLNGQQRCARIDQTFGFFRIHGLLDPTFKETSQVPTHEQIILQTILRNPIKKSEQQHTHTPALYSTFCWPPQNHGAGGPQMCHSQQSNAQTSGIRRQKMDRGQSLNPSSF